MTNDLITWVRWHKEVPLSDARVRPFFQSSCALCERSAQFELCSFCERQLRQEVQPQASLEIPSPLIYWGAYQGSLKRAISALKYNDRPRLGIWLAEQLGMAMLREGHTLSHLHMIAIPLHRERLNARHYNQNARHYNQAAIIAKKLAQMTGAHYVSNALCRHRSTAPLHSLSPIGRQQELKGSFSLGALQKCDRLKPIVLVDDIFTTGSTMREIERLLRQHRFTVAGRIVIAKTPSS